MTQDQAKKLLPFVQAVADGKTLQRRLRANPPRDWEDFCLAGCFSNVCNLWDVRVKPEPREVWVHVVGENFVSGYSTKEQAEQAAALYGFRCVKFIEVIEP